MSDLLPIDEPLGGPETPPQPSREHLGQFVSLHFVARALGRGRRVWIGCAIVGLLVGLALPVALPAKFAAQSTLLMFHNPADDPSKDMATDVALLESEAVAQKVIQKMGLDVTAQKLTEEYSGTAVTDQILQVTISAPTSDRAVKEANVLVSEFLSFRSHLLENQNNAVVGALQTQITGLQSQIKTLTNQANALGNAAPGSANYDLLQTLDNERNQDTAQITTLQQTIQSDDLTTTSIVDQSQPVGGAIAITHSAIKTYLTDAASGLIAGVGIGLGVLTFLALMSDRIRQRSEFAAAAQTPVELSVGHFGRIKVFRKRRLRRRLSTPGRPVELVSRYLRSVVHSMTGSKKLAVVSVDSLEPAALSLAILAGRLAVFEGQRVMVMDLSPDRILGELLGVAEPETRIVFVKGAWVPVLVSVPSQDDPVIELPEQGIDVDGMPGNAWTSPEVVLVLSTLDPGTGASHLRTVADEAVLVVTAGRSNAIQIRAAAEMLRAAGVKVRSTILVGADKNDDSLGLIGDDRTPAHVAVGVDELIETSFAPSSTTDR